MTNKAKAETQQWEQLQDTLNGGQNFCIIEERKAPVLYSLLAEAAFDTLPGYVPMYRHGPQGAEIVVVPTGPDGRYFDQYVELLQNRESYTRYDFQIAMGVLLGYDIDGCIKFAADPVDCSCEKCGGPETELDRIQRQTWIAQGCPHPLKFADDTVEFGPVLIQMDGRPYQHMTLQGQPYGKLMHPHPELIANSPGIQPWSKPGAS